jgi:hypothetical protein
MGTACGCSREKMDEYQEKAKKKYNEAKDYSVHAFNEAKVNYGPSIQDKYQEYKIKMQTIRPEKINDTS